VPNEVLTITNLRSLNLNRNPLKAFPVKITQLTNLRELLLVRSGLVEVPSDIGALTLLRVLNLSSSRLKEVPSQLFDLVQLQELDLSNNALKDLPPAVQRLTVLSELKLHRNKLAQLPAQLAHCHALVKLDLRSNVLAQLPPSLAQLHLQELLVDENPLKSPPLSLTARGSVAVLSHLRAMLTSDLIPVTQSIQISRSHVHTAAQTPTARDAALEIEAGRDMSLTAEMSPEITQLNTWLQGPHNERHVITSRWVRPGRAEIRVAPTRAGTWKLHVTASDTCQASVDILVHAALISAPHCVARGPGLEGGFVGAPSTFLIKALDKYGNAVTQPAPTTRDGEGFSVSIQGPTVRYRGLIHAHSPGVHSVRFTPTQHGQHVISVMWRAQHIQHSPFSVNVQGGSREVQPEVIDLQKQIQEAGSHRQRLIRANLKIERSVTAVRTRIDEVTRAVDLSQKQQQELSRESARLEQEFHELTHVNRALEEEAAAVSVEVTAWRKEAEKKFEETHARLAREVKARDNLEKVMAQMRVAFEEEVKARTRLELLKRELSAQSEDLKENIQELREMLHKLENDALMASEIIKGLEFEQNQLRVNIENQDKTEVELALEEIAREIEEEKKNRDETAQSRDQVSHELSNLEELLYEVEDSQGMLELEVNMEQDFDTWQSSIEQDIIEQVRLANLVESLTREIDVLERDTAHNPAQLQSLETERTQLRNKLNALRDKYSATAAKSVTAPVEPNDTPKLRRTTTRAPESLHRRKTLDMSKMSFLEKLQFWQISTQ
jgi:hypothetical protein